MDVADNVVSVVLVRSVVLLGSAQPSCVQRILTALPVVSVTYLPCSVCVRRSVMGKVVVMMVVVGFVGFVLLARTVSKAVCVNSWTAQLMSNVRMEVAVFPGPVFALHNVASDKSVGRMAVGANVDNVTLGVHAV